MEKPKTVKKLFDKKGIDKDYIRPLVAKDQGKIWSSLGKFLTDLKVLPFQTRRVHYSDLYLLLAGP